MVFSWFRKKEPSARLPGLLESYPPFAPPHTGRTGKFNKSGPLLTLEQCRENLHAYRAAMPGRLRLLQALLGELGVDSTLAYSDPVAFVRQLHPTMLAELPSVHRPELRPHIVWEVSDRSGPDIALSLMADLAMLEADVLLRAKPGCFIGLDVDPADRDMYSYRRPCLLGLVDSLFPIHPKIFYLEEEWINVHARAENPRGFALPDRVIPEAYGDVIGGPMLERLDRDIVDPKLDERLRTTWLGKAG